MDSYRSLCFLEDDKLTKIIDTTCRIRRSTAVSPERTALSQNASLPTVPLPAETREPKAYPSWTSKALGILLRVRPLRNTLTFLQLCHRTAHLRHALQSNE